MFYATWCKCFADNATHQSGLPISLSSKVGKITEHITTKEYVWLLVDVYGKTQYIPIHGVQELPTDIEKIGTNKVAESSS